MLVKYEKKKPPIDTDLINENGIPYF